MTTPGQREKLKELLGQAYRARERMEVGARWQKSLMARVREIGPFQPTTRFLPTFERFVWRLAPVVCLLALVLIAAFVEIEVASWEDPIQLFVNGAEESMLSNLFGA
ncbi:MAG: hypothetical protein ABSB94_02175 [Syntrophorhabdales bacterium]|jgi:hypothetical protein